MNVEAWRTPTLPVANAFCFSLTLTENTPHSTLGLKGDF